MENNKNNIEKNKTVECRFYDEEAFLSEEGIKKVLKDTYKFELNNLELKVVDWVKNWRGIFKRYL